MTLFERVKEISKKRGYSLSETSQKAGLGQRTIYQWKENHPSAERLKAVADVLGVSTDYLLGNTDDTMPAHKEDKSVDLDRVLSEDEGMVMFDGQPLSEEYKRALLAMLRANRGQ